MPVCSLTSLPSLRLPSYLTLRLTLPIYLLLFPRKDFYSAFPEEAEFSRFVTLFARFHTFRAFSHFSHFSRFFALFHTFSHFLALFKLRRNSANLSPVTHVSGPPDFSLNSRNTGSSGSRCPKQLRSAGSVKKREKVRKA